MKWIEPSQVSASSEITEAYGSSILLAEQLARRSIATLQDAKTYLHPEEYQPTSPFAFEDMPRVVERITQAIHKKERIGIWGDFDVDGQTSTSVLVHGLCRVGADVRFHIPNRAKESHGIRLEYLKQFMREGINLLITCDTGITENESLQHAADQGLDVIISDHHTLPEKLPTAIAIINPRLLPVGHPMENLAGVGAAYQIIRALYESLGNSEDAAEYLDLVALGTVADLADLSAENRYYTQMGLRQMNNSLRPSLEAILTSANFRNGTITESMIGFTIGPRLNAVGRLDDANSNVDFLLSQDSDFLKAKAEELEGLNNQRKIAVDGVYHAARKMLEDEPALTNYAALVLAREGWEKGVVGIAASRLSEDYFKPVILMNVSHDTAAGSVRSIEGIDIIRAIRQNAPYLNTFGGHPMAAGLSMNLDRLDEFRAALSRTIKETYKELPTEKELQIDGYLPFANLNLDLVEEIDKLAPFGSGNPPPVLVSRNIEIIQHNEIGKDKNHRRLILGNEAGEQQQVLWWNANDHPLPRDRFDLAYYVRLNEFRGKREVVLEWIDWQAHTPDAIQIAFPVYTQDIQDCRLASNAGQVALNLADRTDICFWAEGLQKIAGLPTHNRMGLSHSSMLAILTPPPSLAILQNALKATTPQQVMLFKLRNPDDSLDGFLRNLSGLVKYAASHYEGQINLEKLAAVLGQPPDLIKSGLDWWQAHGDICIEQVSDADYQIEERHDIGKAQSGQLNKLAQAIHTQLNEIAAFRSFYTRANPANLLRKF